MCRRRGKCTCTCEVRVSCERKRSASRRRNRIRTEKSIDTSSAFAWRKIILLRPSIIFPSCIICSCMWNSSHISNLCGLISYSITYFIRSILGIGKILNRESKSARWICFHKFHNIVSITIIVRCIGHSWKCTLEIIGRWNCSRRTCWCRSQKTYRTLRSRPSGLTSWTDEIT